MTRVTHIITGLSDGGAEAVLFRLCLASPRRDVTVISLGASEKYSEPLRTAGVHLVQLNMPRGRLTLSGLRRLWIELRRHRSDVIQTWMYHGDLVGGVAAKLAGCRSIVWNIRHSDLEPKTTGRSTRLVAALCARLSRVVPSKIIACAKRAETVHRALGYDGNKFVVIPNGYDISRFQPDRVARVRVRAELQVGGDETLLGLVGRWNPQKDHRTLLAAVRRLADNRALSLVFAGRDCDGDNHAMTQLIKEHGLAGRVRLLGSRDDVPSLMNALDLHVLSSSHGEAFPNVVAEAMACGTPCVVTDVGDAAMIVGDTGWVVKPRDPTALAAAIDTALEEQGDMERWAQRQAEARARIVENFSLEQMVSRYRVVWADVASGR